ncbi:MAG: dihydrofolate reductase [Nocardioidaceae bacterium]
MTVTIMAAVARNGVIGSAGTLPWHLPADLRRFKATTMGSVLVMGRHTYESIGRPLPGRTTVVITRQRPYPPDGKAVSGLLVAGSLDEALCLARAEAERLGGEVFVQGGAQVYAEALALADRMLITWVEEEPPGDTFFPEVDWAAWDEVSRDPFPGGAWSAYRRR